MTRDILKDTTRFEYDTDVQDRTRSVATSPSSSASPGSSVATASTTPRRWPCCCARWASRRASSRGSCRAAATSAPARRSVRNSDSHAWVQVYFPDWGWIDFDPTGAVATLAPLPSGPPGREPDREPSGSIAGRLTRPPESADPRDDPEAGLGAGGTTTGGSAGPLIAVAILLAIIVAAIAAVVWQRGPRGPVSAEGTYGSVTRLASRLGFAPRPNQTVYEYAGALADVAADGPPGARDGGSGQGRGRLRRARAGRRPDALAARGPPTTAHRPAPAWWRAGSARAARACGAGGLGGADAPAVSQRPASARARRSGCAAPAPPAPPRRAGSRDGPVRLCARRTARPARNSTTRDGREVHRPHPEPLERQVEQGQQADLEDAVVADDDRPGQRRRARRRRSPRPDCDPGSPGVPPSASAASTPARAGRTRAATWARDSPPGAHASVGVRRQAASVSP